MRRTVSVGIAGGASFSAWGLATMLWPISYAAWNVGRSALFVAFLVALCALATSVARSRAAAIRTFGSVAAACLIAAGLTLATYATATGLYSHRIVQLPEYARDYAYHGYTSPEVYLAANYSALLELQIYSWAIGVVGLVAIAGATGWLLRGFPSPPRSA